LSRDQ